MAVPKQRQNKARKGRRRAGHLKKNVNISNLVKCSNCQEKILPHRACPECGYYKGKEVVSKK